VDPTAKILVERFGMTPLPVEATFFAQTYTSGGEAPVGTAGLGLFCEDPPSRSLFHRLDFDEIWHFYAGDPLRLVLLHPDGSDEEVFLGGDVLRGEQVQFVIPAGTWMAGEVAPGGSWSLFGCTMAPGFTPGCFEGGLVPDLLRSHPGRRADIERLGVPAGAAAHM
jgi:predicted cupin superfamily sugar epimerase